MSYPPSAYKTWTTGEILTAADLNNTVTAINNSNQTEDIDDYSTDNTEMQTTTDPYPAGVESKPATLSGELERIRYVIKQLSGETQWYIDPDTTIAALNTSVANAVTIGDTQTVTGSKTIPFADGSESTPSQWHHGDANTGRYFAADTIFDVTAGATAQKMDSSGRVTRPLQTAFFATKTSSDLNQTGDGTTEDVVFDSETYDIGGNFASSTFTAPVAGKYLFHTAVRLSQFLASAGHTAASLYFTVNLLGSAVTYVPVLGYAPVTGGTATLSASIMLSLAANDTVNVRLDVISGTKTVDIYGDANPSTYFSGILLG